jgi:hypothetical protein
MDTTLLEKQFARMGARLKVNGRPATGRSRFTGFAVDIGWHRVVPNTESRAASMRHLAFLD